MPIDEDVLLAVKDGVVELQAQVLEPHRDDASSFAEAVSEVIFTHQYQAMTDPAILNPPDLPLASVLISRDPIPDALRDGLISLGFTPVDTEQGGREQRSMFSRFQKRARSKLDKWRSPYLRAAEVSPKLEQLEQCLIEDVPLGDYEDIAEEASQALIDGARTCWRMLVAPTMDGLMDLERAIAQERRAARGRMVLHPAFVRGLTAFTGQTIRAMAPDSAWGDDPTFVVDAGDEIGTDPEFRVVKFVVRGNKELLTAYVESVIDQSRGH